MQKFSRGETHSLCRKDILIYQNWLFGYFLVALYFMWNCIWSDSFNCVDLESNTNRPTGLVGFKQEDEWREDTNNRSMVCVGEQGIADRWGYPVYAEQLVEANVSAFQRASSWQHHWVHFQNEYCTMWSSSGCNSHLFLFHKPCSSLMKALQFIHNWAHLKIKVNRGRIAGSDRLYVLQEI